MIWACRIALAALISISFMASPVLGQESAPAFEALKAQEADRAGNPDFDYRLGIAAIAAERPVDAVFALLRVVTADPDFLPGRAALGRAYAMLGAYGAAEREIDYVLAQDNVPALIRDRLSRDQTALRSAMDRQAAAATAERIDRDYRRGIAALDSGNAAEAIAIFEQIRARNPDHLPARAELGRAYALNGQYAAARRELAAVAGNDEVPDDVRDSINRYIAALDTRLAEQQRTRVSGYVRVRTGYDSNVNNATDEERILIPAFAALGLATLSPDAQEQEDAFAETTARLAVVHGLSRNERLLADFSGNFRKNFDEARFDQIALGANVGYANATETSGTFTLAAQAQTFMVDSDVFRNAFGALAGWSKSTDGGTDLAANLQYSYLDFPDDAARNAHRLTLGGTTGRTVGADTYVFGGLYGGREDTTKDIGHLNQWFFGARTGVETAATARLRLSATALAERQIHDDPEPLFMAERRTWRIDVRGGARYRLVDDLDLLLEAAYTRADSNIVLFDYDRITASIGIEHAF